METKTKAARYNSICVLTIEMVGEYMRDGSNLTTKVRIAPQGVRG